MAKALKNTVAATENGAAITRAKGHSRDWRKSMSDNVAYALIVYTVLHIVLTVSAMKETGIKSMALFALVVLVVGIIPACRSFEKRWRNLNDGDARDPALSGAFRRDQILLWLIALGLPFALTGLIKLIASMV